MANTKKHEVSKEGIRQTIDLIIESIRKDPNYKSIYRKEEVAIKNFFSTLFELVEGPSCSRDKASYVAHKIIEADEAQTILSLHETYDIKKYLQMKDYEGETCYWCPMTIHDTTQALSLYFDYRYFNFSHLEKEIEKLKETYKSLQK